MDGCSGGRSVTVFYKIKAIFLKYCQSTIAISAYHDQLFIAIFRLPAILSVMEWQLVMPRTHKAEGTDRLQRILLHAR